MHKIDSHHHFWIYSAEEYGWIDDNMRGLRRDFLPEHLKQTIEEAGVHEVVSVQARQSLTETDWLLDFADRHDFIRGVVGWVSLLDGRAAEVLEKYASRPKLKAVRHVVQGEPDDAFILRDDFNAGIGCLRRFKLVYDILIFERHLANTIFFVDRHPNQVFVLDHIAKPRIKDRLLSPWRENMRELARRENVYCKLSGMTTEADYKSWTESQLQPYFDTALEAFGPKRLMFGSDWPVCLAACEYGRWVNIVQKVIGRLSESEQARIWGGTAAEAYRLG